MRSLAVVATFVERGAPERQPHTGVHKQKGLSYYPTNSGRRKVDDSFEGWLVHLVGRLAVDLLFFEQQTTSRSPGV